LFPTLSKFLNGTLYLTIVELVLLSISEILIVILCILSAVGLVNYYDVRSSDLLESAGALMSESSWTKGKSLPAPGGEASGTILGNKIYFIGGYDAAEKVTNEVRVYDPITDHWSISAPLPIALDHPGSAAYNGKIYVVGGFLQANKPIDTLFIYDPDTNKWDKGKPLPEPRGALAVEFINGTLYAIGGVNASSTPVATNLAYDPKTDAWTEKAPMPTARHHHKSAVIDGKLYVIGGRILLANPQEALTNLGDNEMYNPLNDSWTIMEQMPTKRSGIAAASPVDGNIYVFGGQSVDGAFGNNEKYDPELDQWTTEKPMPTARLASTAVPLDDKIFVIGGKTDLGPHVTDLNEIFHIGVNSTSN
jgi:N-acetylneuraminic acid mutarotase